MDLKKIEQIEKRFVELEGLIVDPAVISNQEHYKAYLKEHGHIAPAARKFGEYKDTVKQIESLRDMAKKADSEPELRQLADEEILQLEARKAALLSELEDSLQEKKKTRNNAIMEIRAGAGGEEAALFAADLFRMYTRYAESKGWKVELISEHSTGLKGFKEAIIAIEGSEVYDHLMYESGVHRVQRVPVTEASGRIHTSTATVAVLPEIEEIELKINPDELRVDTYRASGHGGQNLQKTDSAVRMTHIPTGIVVQCQDERSQLKNRIKALKFLRAKLYEKYMGEQENAISSKRKQQVGTGERSEKIRTYNYPQNRVTDHRANVSLHTLEGIVNGDLDELVEEVRKKLKELEGNG
jgi:peptide chain release factor 1